MINELSARAVPAKSGRKKARRAAIEDPWASPSLAPADKTTGNYGHTPRRRCRVGADHFGGDLAAWQQQIGHSGLGKSGAIMPSS